MVKKNLSEAESYLNKMNQNQKQKEILFMKSIAKVFIIGIVGFFILIALFTSVYKVDAGYRGVVLTFGKPSDLVANEGLHFKIPIAQTVKKMEVRIQKIETTADSSSKDLQDVQTIVALNYHVIPDEANKLYQEVGLGYIDRVVSPSIQESVKAVSARFTAEELIARRPEVRTGIQEFIREKLSAYHIVVDDFNIVNFQFSEEFDKAIEQKVTAEQLKLKADRDLERIKVEAEQTVTQAKAEAESLRLQKQEITPDLVKLREIEVRREAIEKWNGNLPQVTGGAMPFIDITGLAQVLN